MSHPSPGLEAPHPLTGDRPGLPPCQCLPCLQARELAAQQRAHEAGRALEGKR